MTRKDYKLFASVIRKIKKEGDRAITARVVAKALEQDNERFDKSKFFKACEGEE